MPTSPMTYRPLAARMHGMMLIEALVAILIFSIGVISLVGLQARAIAQTTDAKYRADAAFLANQIIGEVWAKRPSMATFAYTGTGTSSNTSITDWLTAIHSNLPGVVCSGSPLACTTNGPSVEVAANQVTVTVRWQAPGSTNVSRHVVIAHVYGN